MTDTTKQVLNEPAVLERLGGQLSGFQAELPEEVGVLDGSTLGASRTAAGTGVCGVAGRVVPEFRLESVREVFLRTYRIVYRVRARRGLRSSCRIRASLSSRW